MINLLPEKNKKEISREYQFRRLALILLFGVLLTLFTLAFLTPSFVLSLYKMRGVANKSASLTAQSTDLDIDLQEKIKDVKVLMDILKAEPYTVPSEIIAFIIKDKTPDNSITDISYTRSSDTLVSVSVKGIAKTRKSLVTFTDLLSHEVGIEKVDVPVSNFAKDTNIAFTFTVTAYNKK